MPSQTPASSAAAEFSNITSAPILVDSEAATFAVMHPLPMEGVDTLVVDSIKTGLSKDMADWPADNATKGNMILGSLGAGDVKVYTILDESDEMIAMVSVTDKPGGFFIGHVASSGGGADLVAVREVAKLAAKEGKGLMTISSTLKDESWWVDTVGLHEADSAGYHIMSPADTKIFASKDIVPKPELEFITTSDEFSTQIDIFLDGEELGVASKLGDEWNVTIIGQDGAPKNAYFKTEEELKTWVADKSGGLHQPVAEPIKIADPVHVPSIDIDEAKKIKKKMSNLKFKMNHPEKFPKSMGTEWSIDDLMTMQSDMWDLESSLKVATGQPLPPMPKFAESVVAAQDTFVAGSKQAELAGSYQSGVAKTEEMFGGNSQKGIEKVTFKDGTTGVVKLIDQSEAQNEVLTSIIADAIGAPAPGTVLIEDNLVIQWKPQWAFEDDPFQEKVVAKIMSTYVDDAQTGGKWMTENNIKYVSDDMPIPGMTDTEEGQLIGLLDVLTLNTDRHSTNWMVKNGKPIAIDHGKTFGATTMDDSLKVLEPVSSPFASSFVKTNKFGEIKSYVDNNLTKDDIALVRTRLKQLEDAFYGSGKGKEFEGMMARLDKIEAKAKGTKNMIAKTS